MADLIKEAIEKLNYTFSEFKNTHDESLKNQDILIKEKLALMDNAMSDMEEKVANAENAANRINGGGGEGDQTENEYQKEFVSGFVRKGDDADLLNLTPYNDVSVAVQGDGGYAVPAEVDRTISRLATSRSPMRQICTVKTIGTEDFKRLINTGGTDSGWVGETAPRPKTNSPTLVPISPTFGEIYANPAATQKSLDDLFFDVEGFLGEEVGMEFAKKEGAALVSGDGVSKPIGLFSGTMDYLDDAARAFGTIQKIKTGVADNLPTGSAAFDYVQNLIDELHEDYHAGASFMAHRKTRTILRKIKDANGNYMWVPPVTSGQNPELFGFGVVTNSNMGQVAAAALPLALGDFKQAFWIFDIVGTRMLRDPYTNKPFVHFYTTKRIGSMLNNSEALKVAECAL